MNGKITYRDIAPGAAEDASFSATRQTDFSTLALNTAPGSVNYLTLEQNRWVLDGTMWGYNSGDAVHLWSEAITDENCNFALPPSLTVDFGTRYSSTGITLEFNAARNEWASEINIKWYQGATLKDDKTFHPDRPLYSCENSVVAFDKIVITFKKTSLPQHRLRLDRLLVGIIRDFGVDEIAGATAINEMDLLSAELPASQLDWELNSRSPVPYMFQLKQPMEFSAGEQLIGVYYVTASSRISERRYKITAQDAVGVLGEQPYGGGVWLAGKSAKALVTEIVGGAFPVSFGSVADATLYGILLPQSKREAIQQVLFAWGKCLRTDGGNQLQIFAPATSSPKVIGAGKTYTGVSVQTAPIVTQVIATAHTYTEDENGDIEIGGVKYADAKTQYVINNPDVTANDIANVITVSEATLVSTHNGAAIAQRVYDHYSKRNTHSSKIIYDGERLGEYLQQPTPWGTSETGHAVSISVSLSGVIAADVKSVGVEQ